MSGEILDKKPVLQWEQSSPLPWGEVTSTEPLESQVGVLTKAEQLSPHSLLRVSMVLKRASVQRLFDSCLVFLGNHSPWRCTHAHKLLYTHPKLHTVDFQSSVSPYATLPSPQPG